MSASSPHRIAAAPVKAVGKALAVVVLLVVAACAAEPTGPAATGVAKGTAPPPPGAGEPAAAGQTMAPGQPVAPPLPEPRSTSEPSAARSEERRVGKECVRTYRSRWTTSHSKKNHT